MNVISLICSNTFVLGLSVVSDSVTLWSLPGYSVNGISRQEHWSGLPFLTLRDSPKDFFHRQQLQVANIVT